MNLDLIFSIGPACRPAYHLKTNFLRTFACPLDWQMNYSLDTCLELFRTEFQTFFAVIREDGLRAGAFNNRRIIDTLNSITSIHHFALDVPVSKAQAEFRSTMLKRYEHLHHAILKSHTVGLICNREDSLDDLSSFLLSFGQIYPNVSFILINIRDKEDSESISMNEYILDPWLTPPRLTIREYSFRDKHENTSDSGAWVGNITAWEQILQDYHVTQHPFAHYVKNFVLSNRSVHIYGAGVYCRKIINFLKRYSLEISDIFVTSPEGNPDSIDEIPVIAYKNITDKYHSDLVIISIINQEESLKLYHMLRGHGFKSVIRIDPTLRIIS